jgi:hypothetical protein
VTIGCDSRHLALFSPSKGLSNDLWVVAGGSTSPGIQRRELPCVYRVGDLAYWNRLEGADVEVGFKTSAISLEECSGVTALFLSF